jgi:hypothetical protein
MWDDRWGVIDPELSVFAVSPRRNRPRSFKGPSLAHDFAATRPDQSDPHLLQIKTTQDNAFGPEEGYDEERIKMIYVKETLKVEGIKKALTVAAALAGTDASSDAASKIKTAQNNVLAVLAA